jgi:hypothetical protein
MWASLAGLYQNLAKKNAENWDEAASERFSSCLRFSAPILTKFNNCSTMLHGSLPY